LDVVVCFGKCLYVPHKNLKVDICESVILHVALSGWETWPLTLREEHRLRTLGNRVLRRIFGSKGEELAVGWKNLHSEELYNLYSSPDVVRKNKSRKKRWAGLVVRVI
jgi:hypothetical protein